MNENKGSQYNEYLDSSPPRQSSLVDSKNLPDYIASNPQIMQSVE